MLFRVFMHVSYTYFGNKTRTYYSILKNFVIEELNPEAPSRHISVYKYSFYTQTHTL